MLLEKVNVAKLLIPLSVGLACLFSSFFAFSPERFSEQKIHPPSPLFAQGRAQLQRADEAGPSNCIEKIITVAAGDTLMKLFMQSGISRRDAYGAITAMEPLYSSRKIRPGMFFKVTLSPLEDRALSDSDADESKDQEATLFLESMSFQPSKERVIKVTAIEEEGGGRAFEAEAMRRPLVRRELYSDFEIVTSLYEAAVNEGLPLGMVAKLIRIHSYDVDFQREIKKGDRYETIFEAYYDNDGRLVKTGNILYSKLTLSGMELPLFLFESDSGFEEYYNDKGQTAKKTLMRTPVDGARLSSGYGLRKHPILGFNKMHKGVDFAAPRGTPVYAAGDGVVERANRYGTYGNYIRIRHHSGYETAYAHLHGFAEGIRANERVRQGQIIGYIGSTGRATAPHLHYEVIKNGKHVNPMSIKIPAGEKLKKQDFARFEKRKEELVSLRQRLVQDKHAANKVALGTVE